MSFLDIFLTTLYRDQTGLEANLRAQFVNSANANVGALISNVTNPGTFKERGVATAQYRTVLTVPTGLRGTVDIQDNAGNVLTSKAYSGLEEQLYSNPGAGIGDIPVNHHTTGHDALQFMVDGVAIDDGYVRAYLIADWNVGNITKPYIKGQTRTGPVFDGTDTKSGRWLQPLMLFSTITYVIVFNKAGSAQTTTVQLTVP